ncbi:MAG: OmpA family protein [Verrucomicrobiales bacterium]|nr:OmpA family protein [Verrucomicrobiales bacterium]
MSKKRHAHHGGAWKVAYADFVTAMMALFLVLWLASQDEKIKEAVERSFRNPFASVTKESTGIIPNKDVQAFKSSSGNFDSASAVELNMLRKIASDLMKTLESNPELLEEKSINLEITPDGMRISLFDRTRKPVFQPDSAELTKYGSFILSTLAWEVSRFANNFLIEVEGHTEQGRPPKKDDYDNWELTADRANAARRKLVEHSVDQTQIRKVAGFADTMPMDNVLPQDESNRRVAILLKMKPDSHL